MVSSYDSNEFAPVSTQVTPYNRFSLPASITHGIHNLPAANPAEAKNTIERLLEKDREEHHCFFNPMGFHNHLSHHLLAAYDLGASATLLKAQYEDEANDQVAIDAILSKETKERKGQYDIARNTTVVDESNWTEHLGDQTYYAPYVAFFTEQIKKRGVPSVLYDYIWCKKANNGGVNMIWRLVGGVFHPLIQVGYGLEFNSPAMTAQALAQTALHKPLAGNFTFTPYESDAPAYPHPNTPIPLLQIVRQYFDSDILKPVVPYDPNAFIRTRYDDALKDGTRSAEISRLCALWWSCDEEHVTEEEIHSKIEELVWVAALLLGGSSKRGHAPRLDFFLMHILNATLFLPSYVRRMVEEGELSKRQRLGMTRILKAFLPTMFTTCIIRGRPRIDIGLVMSFTDNPVPRALRRVDDDSKDKQAEQAGDALAPVETNAWFRIIQDVIHAPDPHTLKAIRTLYYGARMYGNTGPGRVVGTYQLSSESSADGVKMMEETLKGSAQLDGSAFVRIAGVVMDRLGWVTYGEKAGRWDRSALGWDDAWKSDPDGN